MQRVQHLSTLGVGVRTLILFVAVSAVAPRLVRRFGFTPVLTVGLVAMSSGALALLATGPFGGYGALWPGLLVTGVGGGLVVAPSSAAAVSRVPPLQAGMAASAINMARQLGDVLGPSVLGAIVTTHFPDNLHERLTEGRRARRRRPTPGGLRRRRRTAARDPRSPRPSPTRSPMWCRAFTDAVHRGLLVAGVAVLLVAIPSALFVRHRLPGAPVPVPGQNTPSGGALGTGRGGPAAGAR